MASNIIKQPGQTLAVVCSDPTTPQTGDPVRFGEMTGVALTDEGEGGNSATETTVYFGPCVVSVSVKGVDGSGNSAVAVGDMIFYVDADTPKLSKKASGYIFGFALETVNSGSTATIQVAKVAGGAWTGTVSTSDLATGAVTAAKLATTLKTGFVSLPLTSWRLIATNDIAAKNAADGGTISLDTDPTLKRVNGATDKQLRLAWAATSVIEITNSFVYPPDLDDTAAVEVHILAAMSNTNDTPTVAVGYFEGVGDTNAGGNTAAITGTTVAEYTVSIAHGDVGATPKAASISLTPAAHGTDALYIYGVWVEFTRA
jgi:hypothetical protein